ncbi:MAG: winged helix-turn-helix transcriptional regulator [Myxococcota bacterium]|nr:winged helix-turn-helix transcriptional regulator [Myxococcota bacterium]MDP7298416.1 winged helix-turn-helix transcriptional regulator [Myxococcota bacterium]MDP7434493.1 winged helix-turn-helix transcriptional regulator [Myxococcota bacterium]
MPDRYEGVRSRELQRRCDMPSPNVLTSRLREAIEAGILQKDDHGLYCLTRRGRKLLDLLAPLDAWSKEWARTLEK